MGLYVIFPNCTKIITPESSHMECSGDHIWSWVLNQCQPLTWQTSNSNTLSLASSLSLNVSFKRKAIYLSIFGLQLFILQRYYFSAFHTLSSVSLHCSCYWCYWMTRAQIHTWLLVLQCFILIMVHRGVYAPGCCVYTVNYDTQQGITFS